MKKIISTVLVCFLLIGSLFALASCADVEDGTYLGSNGTEISIAGDTYTVKASGASEEIKYTFEIKDSAKNAGEQEIHLTVNSGADKGKTFTYTYEKLEGAFVIDGVKYTKK